MMFYTTRKALEVLEIRYRSTMAHLLKQKNIKPVERGLYNKEEIDALAEERRQARLSIIDVDDKEPAPQSVA